ncbi:MAG: helix-turn-helix domain-containing protein, partial [Pseudomonadota bacterium]
AEQGVHVSTRELAKRIGVTQALLYRFFASKEAILEAVIEHSLAGRWNDRWVAILADTDLSAEQRLGDFYSDYVLSMSPESMRLFMRLNLDGHPHARRFAVPLTQRLLVPVTAVLRHAASLPDFMARPMMHGERELAMVLHGGLMFLAIRKNIYGMPMTVDLDELIRLQVRTFLPGALVELERLHRNTDEPEIPNRD